MRRIYSVSVKDLMEVCEHWQDLLAGKNPRNPKEDGTPSGRIAHGILSGKMEFEARYRMAPVGLTLSLSEAQALAPGFQDGDELTVMGLKVKISKDEQEQRMTLMQRIHA